MKIQTKQFIKNLKGEDTDLKVGEAISNILLSAKEGGKMKMFVLAQDLYSKEEVELDEADLALVKRAVESCEIYNNLVTGQLLVMLK